jgi:hypothetical protein
MKWIKRILFFLLAIVGIGLIAAAVLPKKYTITEKIVIDKPKQDVIDYVKILDNQTDYSVWVMTDPKIEIEITGIDGTVGATQKWKSADKNVGEGKQTITRLDGERMDVDLEFYKPMAGKAKAANLFKAIDSTHTELVSEFYGDDPFPSNLMSHLIGIPMIRKAEKQNLLNIKSQLEGK